MDQHPHNWEMMKCVARRWCVRCGLVWLRNPRSDEAARRPCRWWLA